MNPIINPWYLYLLYIASGIKWASVALGILGLLATVVSYCCYGYYRSVSDQSIYYNRYATAWHKGLKFSASFAIVGMTIGLLMPTSEVVACMIVCQYATLDNINMIYDTIIQTATDLLALFQGG